MDKEYLKKCYLEEGMSCGETVMLAAFNEHGVKYNEDLIKAAGVFGSGIGRGRLCGAVAGGALAIGAKYSSGKAHDSLVMKEKAREYMADIMDEMGSDLCKDLKPKYGNTDLRCYPTIEKAYEVLCRYMD